MQEDIARKVMGANICQQNIVLVKSPLKRTCINVLMRNLYMYVLIVLSEYVAHLPHIGIRAFN